MISVVIPTLDAEQRFAACLTALVPAAVEGFVRDVIVVDGGSRDRTLKIAEQAGADVISHAASRGGQLRAGARRARQPWLLFLHADSVLAPDWESDAARFMGRVDRRELPLSAGAFRFRLDDRGAAPRTLERLVAFRNAALGLPYGDQGLLIPRQLYDEIGGYRDMPLMEDVDIARRLGRRRIARLGASVTTGAVRYRRSGYVRRVARNQLCLMLYAAGMSPERIQAIYTGGQQVPGTVSRSAEVADESGRGVNSI